MTDGKRSIRQTLGNMQEFQVQSKASAVPNVLRRTRKLRIRGSENPVLSTEWVENERLAGHMCGLPIAEGLSRMEAGI